MDEKAVKHENVKSNMLLQLWNNYTSTSSEVLMLRL